MSRNLRLSFWIMAIIGMCLLLVNVLKNPSPLAFGTVAAGIFTFFSAFGADAGPDQSGRSSDERLRSAIASAVVVQYLVLVGTVTYFTNEDAFGKLLPITQTLLASFTATIAVVVAFYFGASAYVDGKRIDAKQASSAATRSATATPDA